MQKLVLFILAIILPTISIGQRTIISKKLHHKWQNAVSIKQAKDTNYIILSKNKKIELICVDDSLKEVYQKRIKASYEKNDLRIVGIKNINNHNYVFASFWNYKHKQNYLFYRKLNSTGDFEGEWINISKIYQPKEQEDIPYFIKTSAAKNYFAIYSKNYKDFDRGPIEIHLSVFDHNFKQIASFFTNIGDIKSQNFVEQMEVGNNATVYLKVVENKGVERNIGNYVYKKNFIILSASKNDSNFVITKLHDTTNMFITDAIIKVMDNNSLLVGGYYSNLGFASIAGTFLTSFSNGKQNNFETQSFSKALINNYIQPIKFTKSKIKEALKFTAQRLEYSNDGSVFIVGELITKFSASKNGIGKGSMYDNDVLEAYLYGDIMVKKINGINNWEQIIHKRQKGNSSPSISFSYSFDDKEFSFVFNSFIKDSKNFNAIYKENTKGKTKLIQMDIEGRIVNEKSFNFTSMCNPLIYKPFPFYDKMFFLTKNNRLVYFDTK
jgi:hypothetical protein